MRLPSLLSQLTLTQVVVASVAVLVSVSLVVTVQSSPATPEPVRPEDVMPEPTRDNCRLGNIMSIADLHTRYEFSSLCVSVEPDGLAEDNCGEAKGVRDSQVRSDFVAFCMLREANERVRVLQAKKAAKMIEVDIQLERVRELERKLHERNQRPQQ